MEGIDYHSLRQINTSIQVWKIKARITRLWEVYNPNNKEERWSQDFILLDENRDHIHGRIMENMRATFERHLKEGKLYHIQKFSVIKAKDYSPIKCDFQIFFGRFTMFKEIQDDNQQIPRHKFEFLDFADLPSRSGSFDYAKDVIGKFKSLSNITTIDVRGKLIDKRDITLENERGMSIEISLWGNKAHEVPSDFISPLDPVVIVVTSIVVKKRGFKHQPSSTGGTMFYINLDIPETNVLKQSGGSSGPTQVNIRTAEQIEEEMYKERTTVNGTIQAFKNTPKESHCIATISEVDDILWGWYYMSCNTCKFKVDGTESKPWCNNCGKELHIGTPRYKLQMKVEDSTGSISIVAFGDQVEKLINKHVDELCAIYVEENGSKIVHEMLQKLIGLKRMFKIASYYLKNDTYTVSQVQTVSSLLEQKYPVILEHKISDQDQDQTMSSGTQIGSSSSKRTFKEVEEISLDEPEQCSSSTTRSVDFPPTKTHKSDVLED